MALTVRLKGRMAKMVQQRLFVEGKKLDHINTYLLILNELSIDNTVFKNKWMKEENISKTMAKFEEADKIATGHPTLVIEKGGSYEILASGYFDYKTMSAKLEQLLEEK